MASTINATNTSNGVVITPDSSGSLALQVAGVNVMSFSSSGILTGITSQSVVSYLGSPVTMTSANTWYDGPNTGSIGANGQTWLILAKGEIANAGGAVAGEVSIHDGTSFLAGGSSVGAAASWVSQNIAAYFTTLTGAKTFTLKAAANAASSTLLASTAYYSVPKNTWIAAIRLA